MAFDTLSYMLGMKSGGGGGGLFVINVTEDDDGNYTADKTYTEIKSAYDSDMMPIVFDDDKMANYLQSVDDGYFVFARCVPNIGENEKIQGFYALEYSVSDDNAIEFKYGGVVFVS